MIRTTTKDEAMKGLYINNLPPYTTEELDTRLEEAQEDFASGRCYTSQNVLAELRQFISSL